MEVKEILDEMKYKNYIELEQIPEIDLYMDQVIQMFEGNLGHLKRNEEEKILTKTMINNYAKGKLLLPIKNKKYSKEHLILMSFIYNLKGALSISDIKKSLDTIISSCEENDDYSVRELYKGYIKESNTDIDEFKNHVNNKIDKLMIDEKSDDNFEKQFLLLCSLVNMSNMYRRLSEKIIDDIFSDDKTK